MYVTSFLHDVIIVIFTKHCFHANFEKFSFCDLNTSFQHSIFDTQRTIKFSTTLKVRFKDLL